MAMTKKEKSIVELYVRYFGEVPSKAEIEKYNKVGNLKKITKEFIGEAFKGSTTEEVNNAFQNLFGRDAKPDEMKKYSKVFEKTKKLPLGAIKNAGDKVDKGVYQAKKAIAIMLAEQKITTNYDLDKITEDTYEAVYDPETKKLLVDTVAELENKIEEITDGENPDGENPDGENPDGENPDGENPDNGSGETFTLTTSTDTFVGIAGKNDTVTGTTLTLKDTDTIIDQSTTDNDTLNLTLTSEISAANTNKAKVSGIENVNITISSTAADVVEADNFDGVKNLTVTRADVTVGGSTIVGNKKVTVNEVNADKIAKITTGAGTKDAAIDQTLTTATDSKAGVTVDANTATGAVSVTGAATVNAANATSVTVTAINAAVDTENAKAVTINAAKATTISVADSATSKKFTGAITVDAVAATTVTIANAVGGATVTAKGATAANSVKVSNIDDSGATITTSYVGTTTATNKIVLIDDSVATTTDVATVSAAGITDLSLTGIEKLTLSGNGQAATFINNAAADITLTGDQDVTVSATAANLTTKTVTDSTTAGTTTVEITSGDDADLSKIAADKIVLKDDGTSADYTLASNANLVIAADQTDLTVIGKTASSTVNVSTADDTAADGTTIDLTVGDFVADTNVSTLNIDATVGKFTATKTTLDVTGTDATTLNITGTKDVDLGTTSAKTVNAANLTGALTATLNGAAAATSVTGGAGDDVLVFNDTNSTTTVYTVDAGNGDNTLKITSAKEGSSFSTGSGDDTIEITGTAAYVVVTGAGNDTVNVGSNKVIDSIIVMGEGTSDKLAFTSTADLDLKGKSNFAVTGVEIIDVSNVNNGAVIFSATQFAQDNTFKLSGDATDLTANTDRLKVINTSTTAGATIDASNVTFDSTQAATLVLQGAALLADTITGSAKNDTIIASSGADIINGGAGTDTYDATALDSVKEVTTAENGSSGVVINLGTTAITNTTILGAGVGYTADSVTSVASNTVAYVYGSSHTTNSAVTQSLASIENVIGSGGDDYIVGSVSANVINGGAGDDYIIGGKGADILTGGLGANTFVYATGDASVGTATLATALTLAENDKIVGSEVIKDIKTSDKLDLGNASAVASADLVLAANEYIIAQGTYVAATGTFTVGGTGGTVGNDSILYWDTDSTTAGVQAGYVVLVGVNNTDEGSATAAAGVITF